MTGAPREPEVAYTIERLRPEQFDVLLPIMKDAFGMTVDEAYFRWKFLDNPAGNFIGFIARAPDGEIGAYYGVIPERYRVDGESKTIYQSCDTMTHSKHRRRGLFQRLALHCYQHLRDRGELFVIGFGGGQSTPGFLKFGWRHLFDVRPYALPSVLCALRGWLPDPGGATVRETRDPGKIVELFDESNQDRTIHLIKDAGVLSWRVANPRKKYRTLVCEAEGRIAGYAIVDVDNRRLELFDFYAARHPAAERALSRELCKIVRQERLRGIITFAQERTPYAQAIGRIGLFANRTGFGPLRDGTPFILYAPEEAMDRFGGAGHWNITPVDHDAW